jgi:hypothetical protein
VILLDQREHHLALLVLGSLAGHPLAHGPLRVPNLLALHPKGTGREEQDRRRAENGL